MKTDHLNEQQLKMFSSGEITETESELFGKHLLFCPECREKMPPPTRERLANVYNEAFENMKKILKEIDES